MRKKGKEEMRYRISGGKKTVRYELETEHKSLCNIETWQTHIVREVIYFPSDDCIERIFMVGLPLP